MNSKNIGPIIHRLFHRSVVFAVIAGVLVVSLAVINIFISTVNSKLSTIEQLKSKKVDLERQREDLEQAKTEAQSEFDCSKEALGTARESLKQEIDSAQRAIAEKQKHVLSEIQNARDAFAAAQKSIWDAVNALSKEVDRARAAAEKAEQVYEEGSYAVAWLTHWGKSWEEYLLQKNQQKVARENAKKEAKQALEDALDKYNKAKGDAPAKVTEAEKKFLDKKETEEAAIRQKKVEADKNEEAKEKEVSDVQHQTSNLEKQLQGIDEKKQEVESCIIAIGRTLAAVPWWHRWWQQIQSEVWMVLRKYVWTIIGAAFVFITPVGNWIRRLAVWFGPGAWVERRRRPLAFPEWHNNPEAITTTSNHVSLEVQVKLGEIAWFRDDYLDRTTRPKGTKFGLLPIFSKRFWLMSLIDGLWWMTVIKGDGENKTSFKVSDTDDSASEFAVVEIPAHSSLIIRPHFIIGLIFPEGSPPELKRHWRLTQLEAWCVGQLWFFELAGPTRVVLRGARGVQPHASVNDDSIETRLNPGSLIGFSPTAKLYICRSESVWQYLANKDPFYNYAFEGDGTFLTHETQEKLHRSGPLSWLAGIGDALLKLAGF
jgi:hypothetical protein